MSNIKQRTGATEKEVQSVALPKWTPSTNYTTQIIMFVGSLFTFFTFKEAEIGAAVSNLYAVFSVIMLGREKAKTGVVAGWKQWLSNPNTYGYFGILLTPLLPTIAPQLAKDLEVIVRGLIDGNWQQVLGAAFSLLTFIFFKLRGGNSPLAKGAAVIAFLFIIPLSSEAQSNKDLKKRYVQGVELLEKDTFEILPQPGEFPQDIVGATTKRDGTTVLVTNWGANYHKLTALRARIAAECTKPVHVRITDTAMDSDHQQLARGKKQGFNYTTDAQGIDRNGHGTHVAGIIFASDFGICYDLIKKGLVTYEFDQILTGSGSGSFAWFQTCEQQQLANDRARKAQGIRTVISGSFGGNTSAIAGVEAAMKAVTDNGGVYCIAAGNTGGEGVQYPGSSAYAITCASLDESGARSSFSTTGPQVWNGQPGRGIQSTWLNNQFATLSGTSMATPFLSGVVTIALSKWGDLLPNYTAVKTYLAAVSRDISPTGKDNATGYGVALIEGILNTKPGTVGPPNPPNPPIDTTAPPVRPMRVFSLQFDEKYKMFWGTTIPTPNGVTNAVVPKIHRVSKSTAKANSSKFVTIGHIELSVNSTTNADVQRKQITDAFNTLIFANRGLVLEGGSDFADAIYWSAFFAEMLIWTQYKVKIPITITKITGSDNNGSTVTFTREQLRHVNR